MTARMDKILAAKRHIEGRLGDIIEKNFDESGGALEAAGTFTALLEAYRAVEIAEIGEKQAERDENMASYTRNIMGIDK
ncbi:hypothetical protein G3A56_02405 [Rhizobium oryzihabitans]|uniref:Uncharacterized protein n=1 Tax=Rhizobium oryzihabitans TaxID=2267833 RepID=A0A7L5BE38_9HYPH|nr:hypothetical protein [Rhizobium oryzihabitans]QIB36983.1 hypothetical protein G3A56_02405 [Rhizobium oryzihabitans]